MVRSMHAVEAGLIGSSVLDLVTSGIHDDPRTLYREYLQNSADAFVSCGEAPRRVEITIEPGARLVRIRDNGSGLSAQDAVGGTSSLGAKQETPGDRVWLSRYRPLGRACVRRPRSVSDANFGSTPRHQGSHGMVPSSVLGFEMM